MSKLGNTPRYHSAFAIFSIKKINKYFSSTHWQKCFVFVIPHLFVPILRIAYTKITPYNATATPTQLLINLIKYVHEECEFISRNKNKVIYECENSVNIDLFSYFGIAVQAFETTHIFILFCMTHQSFVWLILCF